MSTSEAIARYYDLTTRHYRFLWDMERSMALRFGFWDEGVRSLRAALAREDEVLAQRLDLPATAHVLDAGCGVGGSVIHLARRFGCRVTGITLSPVQRDLAGVNARALGLADRTAFELRDFHHTGFADGSFAAVWAIESVCHSPDKAAFLREAARVLQPGGKLIVADYFMAPGLLPRQQARVQDWLRGWESPGIETVDGMRALALQAGFGDVRFEDATTRIAPSSRRMFALAGLGLVTIAGWRLRGLRKPVSEGNVLGAWRQFGVFRRGLACYGIFEATRGAG